MKAAATAAMALTLAASAAAMSFPEGVLATATSRRALQKHYGARDVNICGPSKSKADDRAGILTAHAGTLHDDQSDRRKPIDCTKPGACSQAGTNNGYGDNLHCGKTIQGPKGTSVTLIVTQINLEAGPNCGKAHNGVGCDVLEVFDGPNAQSPLLGRYSGTVEPTPITSTGNTMFVQFLTDAGNYAIQQAGVKEDPGFYADWHVSKHINIKGPGICPAKAEYTTAHGSIHDDANTNVNCIANPAQCGAGGCGKPGQPKCGDGGYSDNTNCYTVIHAAKRGQVRFTFTQMNLELTGCTPTLPNGGCPPGGCDYVELFDGKERTSPSLGKFSGYKSGADLPSVVTSGEYLRIEFHTDYRNCGIKNSQDPGWYGTWDFVENGENICSPSAGVLHTRSGVLHDDDTQTVGAYRPGSNGYGNNLKCGVRLRAQKGDTVNLHIVQMNLEGDGNGICDPHSPQYIGHSCNGNGGDFLEIYDGRNEKAPLLAKMNGQPTDQVLKQDTFTSTGRDMFVRFVTDNGNYGLTNTVANPGFYAEWRMIKNGKMCGRYQMTPGMAIAGHNNEQLQEMTVQRCEKACCARPWCKSFDFMQGFGGGTCNLADVSASVDQATVVASQSNNYYERPVGSLAHPTKKRVMGATGCAKHLADISAQVTKACCADKRCGSHVPQTCSSQCARRWMPFAKECSMWLESDRAAKRYVKVTKNCENEEYGRWHQGQTHGRCSDGDLQQYQAEFKAACCSNGHSGKDLYCPTLQNKKSDWVTPVNGNQPICTPQCAKFMNEVWAECNPRFATQTLQSGQTVEAALKPFMRLCQGITAGGGH